MMWPVHCVQNTKGAEFHPKLKLPEDTIIINKGTNKDVDSYSGFGTPPEKTELLKELKERNVLSVCVVGLAFDYCVGYTALDAIKNGFETIVLEDLTKSISNESEHEMREKLLEEGATIIESKDHKY